MTFNLRRHAPALIVFLFSFFFILTISNPAIYMNDEWITANQLHQLDIGHQVTFSEGKYGVTQNGTVSAYFTSRQNILMYSLAFPVTALPLVKLFSLFGDNFRLIVILAWSLCPVLIALIADACYPEYSRFRGVRAVFPVMFLALILFMVNILLYKQFPFSPPDAPFEVAALVLTNQVFFALIAAIIFSIMRLMVKNTRMALFGTIATVSCSSYIFWAAAAKDHILTTLVYLLVLLCYLQYIAGHRQRNAVLAFVFSGLLIWIRPEVGFFVSALLLLFFAIPLVREARSSGATLRTILVSLLPAAGTGIGAIPFFINNGLVSHNWLIPIFDLPRDLAVPGASAGPAPLSQVMMDPTLLNQAAALSPEGSLARVAGMISHALLGGFTYDNMVRGLVGTLTFPENGSVGFLMMCPIAVIGIVAVLLWHENILAAVRARNGAVGFIFLMILAVFFSYMTKFGSMNISSGILPDMRYLSPAYAPCGILAVFFLSKTPCLKSENSHLRSLLKYSVLGSLVLLPVMLFIMLFTPQTGNVFIAFVSVFRGFALLALSLCLAAMILSRVYPGSFFIRTVPFLLVLVIISAFSFQVILTSLYALLVKTNGYPFWIPLVREGVALFIQVQYITPA